MSDKLRAADKSILFCIGHYSQSQSQADKQKGSSNINFHHHNRYTNLATSTKSAPPFVENIHYHSISQSAGILTRLIGSATTGTNIITRSILIIGLCESKNSVTRRRLVQRSKLISGTITHRQSVALLCQLPQKVSYRFCLRRSRRRNRRRSYFACQCQL